MFPKMFLIMYDSGMDSWCRFIILVTVYDFIILHVNINEKIKIIITKSIISIKKTPKKPQTNKHNQS